MTKVHMLISCIKWSSMQCVKGCLGTPYILHWRSFVTAYQYVESIVTLVTETLCSYDLEAYLEKQHKQGWKE